jgi:hypothetical protein
VRGVSQDQALAGRSDPRAQWNAAHNRPLECFINHIYNFYQTGRIYNQHKLEICEMVPYR